MGNITNKHTVFGYKPSLDWPGINTSKPVQFYSGIQIHACVPIRGCYSILYHLGTNYTANDTFWRYWNDDIYITNSTFKMQINCGSFYNYNYATGKFDGPCIDVELHYDASLHSQPKQKLTNAISDEAMALGLSNVAWFPYSLSSQTKGKLKIWNYQMPEDGYYGHGETIALLDFDEDTCYRTYWGHTFGSRSGYDSGIKNWLWLYAPNMTCDSHAGCDFEDTINVVVGGQFGPADFIYIDGMLRGETLIGLDKPAQSDATSIILPNGKTAIQVVQSFASESFEGSFQFTCAVDKFTPYSANKFTFHATLCTAVVRLRTKIRSATSYPLGSKHYNKYSTNLSLVELDVTWLSKLGLINKTKVGPYPMVPYES